MNAPKFISYELWRDNVIAFCVENNLKYGYTDEDSDPAIVGIDHSDYQTQKYADRLRWTQYQEQLLKQKDSQ